MKKLGLIGGLGPESTIPYYHDIVYGVQKAVDRPFFPCLTVESVDVFQVVEMLGDERYDDIVAYLMTAINNVANAGAEFAAIASNTPHIVFDRLQRLSPIPLLSIVGAAKDEACRRGYRKIGLLGTIFTMRESFFKEPFVQAGIEVVTPTDVEMEYVSDKIYSEIELGIIKDETIVGVRKIIERLKADDGIEAIVLGCTELPLLLNDRVSPVPCLDTMHIHIDAIVKEILS